MRIDSFTILVCLLLAVLLEPSIIAHFFSYDDTISSPTLRNLLRIAQIGFLAFSIWLWMKRKSLSSTFRIRLKELYIVVISFIFAFFLAESIARVWFPTPNGYSGHDLLFELDEELGWKFRPNSQSTILLPYEAEVDVSINAQGFRSPLISPTQNNTVLVLGDSFVSALEVKEEARFTHILDQQWGDSLTVFNAGVNGYGPLQSYLLLERLMESHSPSIVIQVLYIRNDIFDLSPEYKWMSTMSRPYASLEDGNFRITYPKPISLPLDTAILRQRITKNPLRLSNFSLYNRLQLLFSKSDTTTTQPPEVILCSPKHFLTLSKEMNLLEQLFIRSAQLCETRNIPFVVVLAPSFVQVNESTFHTLIDPFSKDEEVFDSRYPNKQLMRFNKAHPSLRIIDLLPHFQSEQKPYSTWYYPRNQHWNEEGHAFVARILSDELKDVVNIE